MTGIEWTERTWNPIVGCSIVSPGCTNCYAMRMAGRLEAIGVPHYAGTTQKSKAGPVWTGKLALAPDNVLTAPLRRKKPTTYFVNSMGDVFHDDVPDEWIDRVFAVMALAPQHTFQILTKRSKRMREYMTHAGPSLQDLAMVPQVGSRVMTANTDWPLPNVWLGVSAEDQVRADERIPDLLATPAAVRWVSAEPLLGPIDFRAWMSNCYECGASCGLRLPTIPSVERCTECGEECGPDAEPVFSDGCPKCSGELEPVCPDCGHYMVYQHPDTPVLDWIVVGGESGKGARPMHPDCARAIRDQCKAAGVPFFFKQHGDWIDADLWHRQITGGLVLNGQIVPRGQLTFDQAAGLASVGGFKFEHRSDGGTFIRVGKARAGRLLDSIEHNAMPEAPPCPA